MNDEQRKAGLELLNELVEDFDLALTNAWGGNQKKSAETREKALAQCAKLKSLLATPPVKSHATSTVWVGLAPATLERLLTTSPEFSRQFEERSKDCGRPFIERDGIVIELIGTELGSGLGARLFKLGGGLTKLDLSTIVIGVERIKKDFACAVEALGVPHTKELLEVFVQTI